MEGWQMEKGREEVSSLTQSGFSGQTFPKPAHHGPSGQTENSGEALLSMCLSVFKDVQSTGETHTPFQTRKRQRQQQPWPPAGKRVRMRSAREGAALVLSQLCPFSPTRTASELLSPAPSYPVSHCQEQSDSKPQPCPIFV